MRLARHKGSVHQNRRDTGDFGQVILFSCGAAVTARGVIILAFQDEKDADRRHKSGHVQKPKSSEVTRPPKKRTVAPEVGNSLRMVYQQTINEDIPPEMLDLLGKLG